MIVVDTSIIVAYMNSADDHHQTVARWLDGADDDLVTTPLIIAETDHLIATRGGREALDSLYADLAAGAYLVDWWPAAIASTVKIAESYADTPLGLAHASLVAVAQRSRTIDIATLDERHFRAVRPLTGERAFRLLPADAG